jgi:hypothetical protein
MAFQFWRSSKKPKGSNLSKREPSEVPRALLLTPLFSAIVVLFYAATEKLDHGSTFWTVLAVGLGTAGAAMVSGMLLGFLFGLPRVERGAHAGRSGTDDTSGLETNSNLDEVSDWLTKILVGLGLVQLGRLSHAVSHLGTELAPGFGGMPGAKTFAVAVMLYSAIDGFLIGYIWTRVDLSRIFKSAHESLLRRKRIRAIDTTLAKSNQELEKPLETVQAAQELLSLEAGDDSEDDHDGGENDGDED